MADPYHPFRYLFFTLVPNYENIKSWFDSFFIPSQMGKIYYDGYNTKYLFMGVSFCLCVVFIIWLLMAKGESSNKEKFYMKLGVACLVTVFFWIIYIGGEAFILASIMSHFPIIKGFRYLYKAVYIIPGLLILPTCIGLSKISNFKVIWKIIFYGACFLCLVEQVYECKSAINGPFPEYNYDYLYNIEGFDKNNYRVLFVTSDEDNHEFIDCMPYANANVTACIQTVGGYELTCGKLPESMTALYAGTEWVGLSGSNAVRVSELTNYFDMDQENLEKFILALNDNSIGYIMTRKGDLDNLFYRIGQYGYLTKKIYYNEQNQIEIYRIENITPIATDENGNLINITRVNLDNLHMTVEEGINTIFLNVRYNKNLNAYIIDFNGKNEVNIEKKGSGIKIDLPSSGGTLVLEYRNEIYFLGILMAAIYLPVIVGTIAYAFIKTENYIEKDRSTG